MEFKTQGLVVLDILSYTFQGLFYISITAMLAYFELKCW